MCHFEKKWFRPLNFVWHLWATFEPVCLLRSLHLPRKKTKLIYSRYLEKTEERKKFFKNLSTSHQYQGCTWLNYIWYRYNEIIIFKYINKFTNHIDILWVGSKELGNISVSKYRPTMCRVKKFPWVLPQDINDEDCLNDKNIYVLGSFYFESDTRWFCLV